MLIRIAIEVKNLILGGGTPSIVTLLSSGFTDDGLEAIARPGTQQTGRERQDPASITLNGVDQYVDCGDAGNIDVNNFTIVLWFKPDVVDGTDRILRKGGSYELKIDPLSRVQFQLGSSNLFLSNPQIVLNEWNFIAVKVTNLSVDIILNNNPKTNYGTGVDSGSGGPLTIGSLSGISSYFDGKLKDLQIYDTPLRDSDITKLYNQEEITTKPVNHYFKSKGSGTIAFDSGTAKQHGTIVNATAGMHTVEEHKLFRAAENVEGYSKYTLFDGDTFEHNYGDKSDLEVNDFRILIENIYCIQPTSKVHGFLGIQADASGNGGIVCRFGAAGTIDFYIETIAAGSYESISTPSSYSNQLIKKLEFIKNGTSYEIKIDDVQVASGTLSGSDILFASETIIGNYRSNSYNSTRFGGYIGKVTIFNSNDVALFEETGYNFTGDKIGTYSTSIIPAQDANKSLDIFGNPLQFRGKMPLNAKVSGGWYLQGNGVDIVVPIGDTGINATSISVWVKQLADNQVLFSLQNSTATSVSVSAGVLTFGGSLTASNITLDGVSATANEAGALLNDNAWHKLEFDLTSITANNLKLLGDGTNIGNVGLSDFKIDDGVVDIPLNNSPLSSVVKDIDGTQDFTSITGFVSSAWQQDKTGQLPVRNLLEGCSLYTHATEPDLFIPYFDGVPYSGAAPTGYTKISDHPAIVGHNGSEAEISVVEDYGFYQADSGNFLYDVSDEPNAISYDDFVGEGGNVGDFIVYQLDQDNRTVKNFKVSQKKITKPLSVNLTTSNIEVSSYPVTITLSVSSNLNTSSLSFNSYVPSVIINRIVELTTTSIAITSYEVSTTNAVNVNLATASIIVNSYPVTVEATDLSYLHLVVLGQSQAGGFGATPAITTVGDPDVMTLTDGPIEPNNTTGTLVTLTEGDNFTNTGQAASNNVETIATAMGQQIHDYVNNPNLRVVVTVHAFGGRTIQRLSKGGDSGMFEEAIASVERVSNLVGKANYQTHLVWFHGGSGDNVGSDYGDKYATLISDFKTDVASFTDQATINVFSDQQRTIGTPDYGQQLFEQSAEGGGDITVHVASPRYNSDYQGDNIHLTNHGTRYMAMMFARAIYDELYGSGWNPLYMGTPSWDGSKIIIPLNGTPPFVLTGNGGISIRNTTDSVDEGFSASINGSNLEITLTDAPTAGIKTIEIRMQRGGTGTLRDSLSDSFIFQDAGATDYESFRYAVRQVETIDISFGEEILLTGSSITVNSYTPTTTFNRYVELSTSSITVTAYDVNINVSSEIIINLSTSSITINSYAPTATIVVPVRILMDLSRDPATTNSNGQTTASPDFNGNHWNNFLNPAVQDYGTMVDTDGNSTSIGFELLQMSSATGFADGLSSNDTGATGNTTKYPSTAWRDSWFTWSSGGNTPYRFRIYGLDSSKTYKIFFTGSRNGGGARAAKIVDESGNFSSTNPAKAGGNTNDFYDAGTDDADYHTDDNGVEYTISGVTEEIFAINTNAGSTFGYVGIIDIEEQ